MGGISGIISKNKIEKNIIETMTDKIIHRGPDGFGYYYGQNFVFGHRRLSIVDLSEAGHQPMQYQDRYIITFNGEIYNHFELRIKLEENGYKFQSHTDTEVIMASYDFWGVECLKQFNGMWAFVIYDIQEDKYFISRDRFGKKPFYYYKDEDDFIFASEIKVILAHPKIKTKPNYEYLSNYIKNGNKEYIKETAFESIFRFDLSSYFEGNLKDLFDGFKEEKFWELKPNLSNEKFDEEKAKEYAKKYYELLEDSVRIRLRADVKIGSALSGGLDSSSIVYLVNKLLKEQSESNLQETFSSVYVSEETKYCDESYFINIMSKYLAVNSNTIEPVEDSVREEYFDMISSLENPPPNSLMSSWHTFKLVKSCGVKVTLDGQGADEQLAGYLPYLMNYIASLPIKDVWLQSYKCLKIPNSKKFILFGLLIRIYKIFFGDNVLIYTIKLLTGKNFIINLNQKLAHEFQTNLVSLLHYADHTSMHFGVESRMPFMDYRLVEFLATVPSCYKMRDGWTKYIARLSFDGKLPDEVNWRKDKMGWPIPEQQWFSGKLKHWFDFNIENCVICEKLFFKSNFSNSLKKLNISIWEKVFFGKNNKNEEEK